MAGLHLPMLNALRAHLETFLGGPVPHFLNDVRYQPIGLGHYLGHSREEGKKGDISGLRLDAQVTFPVAGANAADREIAATAIDTALLGQDRATLRGAGFYKLVPSGRKLTADSLELNYHLTYEFIQTPEQNSLIIDELDLSTASGSRGPDDKRPLRDILDELPHTENLNIP